MMVRFLSVDIKQENVDYANKFTSERTSVYCSDSVKFLWDLDPRNKIFYILIHLI